MTNKCDIIDTEKTYSLFSDGGLPFSVSVKYIHEYQVEEAEHTDEELVNLASYRLDALTATRLGVSDLLKVRTKGEFTEDGYLMSSEIIYLSEVTERVVFNAQQ